MAAGFCGTLVSQTTICIASSLIHANFPCVCFAIILMSLSSPKLRKNKRFGANLPLILKIGYAISRAILISVSQMTVSFFKEEGKGSVCIGLSLPQVRHALSKSFRYTLF